ncbi:MAG: glutamate--cysteine ligase [Actinomycetota bacterium]
MGQEIDRDTFDPADYDRFDARVRRCMDALGELLARPGFGTGPASLGAEVELALVDSGAHALPLNHEVIAALGDPRVTVELVRFNLEYNDPPHLLAGRPFAALERSLAAAIARLGDAAAPFGGRIAAVGILPTIREADLGGALSDVHRFRALSHGLRRLRQRAFTIRISGREPLDTTWGDLTLEGANTGFQVHLRVAPDDFARTYNAAQIATAPALACAGNSPIFLGRRLWQETRIPLFRQAIDDRDKLVGSRGPARVAFGHGWLRTGVEEIFAETVALYAPLLPVCGDDDPLAQVRSGGVPELSELRLHNGTVWRWNRPVYDPAGGGHLRLEMRALPAGPTPADMAANAAFLIGLTLALRDEEWMTVALPFRLADANFSRAAEHGLDAELLWPAPRPPSPRPVQASRLVLGLVETARRGLVGAGVDPADADRALGVVADRVEAGVTGSRWQLRTLERLEPRLSREEALPAMLELYLAAAASGEPVHRWPQGVNTRGTP